MQNLRDFPVVDYLRHKGFVVKKRGNRWFTHSPYRDERTPSFCIFPDNAWVDFGCDGSSPRAGNVMTLAKHFGDDLRSMTFSSTWTPPPPVIKAPWNGIPDRFLEVTEDQRTAILTYATARGVHKHYQPGVFFTKTDTGFDKHPALLFPHVQTIGGSITGAKFRAIEGDQRYSSSGLLGYYVYKTSCVSYLNPTLFLVEGEINANSLGEYCDQIARPALILACGGVNNIPNTLPGHLTDRVLLLDYDGSEAKYRGRVDKYKHLNVKPLKLVLPKGEDINSLYCRGEMRLIDHLL